MSKQKSLEAIAKAKDSHLAQMQKIEDLIGGKSITDPTAVAKTKCGFGMWLYDETNHMREILGSQFYDEMEFLHGKWHTEYFRIYNIYFKEEKGGFMSKLFGGGHKLSDMEKDKIKLYYAELKVTTSELLKVIGTSERRLQALSETKFY